MHVFKQGVERLPRGGRTRQALLLHARVGGNAAINLAAARAPWLHAARMPGVVTSTGIALGEPPWPFQQHSIARHESGLSMNTMVNDGKPGHC